MDAMNENSIASNFSGKLLVDRTAKAGNGTTAGQEFFPVPHDHGPSV